jgi:hypothetical protein
VNTHYGVAQSAVCIFGQKRKQRSTSMTQDEIIEMARQAKLPHYWETGDIVCLDAVKAFAKLVAEREREACAKLCEERWKDSPWLIEAAAAIRARGDQ